MNFLNVRVKNIKVLEENIAVNLGDLGLGNDFLDMTTHTIGENICKSII